MRLKSLLLFAVATLLIAATPARALQRGTGRQETLAKQWASRLISTLSLPDRADYSADFYYRNCLSSVRARQEMPWGCAIPDDVFFHFVLPVRVNNENLDTARIVFYDELKDRVKNLTMSDAILEVNHWCHEKVSYRPSDVRTGSPLATVRTAYGRCGEESTLLVAALRAVGLPARQVYTPRWAHTDDNHAWVEAWADGKWYFLGACEPEPVLNLGWFNESASRAMLMHTKVAGHYTGPEQVIERNACFTEINVTANYAPTSTVNVMVVDADGRPVEGATVEFKIYNYAEFYTLVKRVTGPDGTASLIAGRGDLLVWVTKDDFAALKKVSWKTSHNDTIALINKHLPTHLDLDIVPPAASAAISTVTDRQRARNDVRKAHEDSLRQAYEATMPVEAWRGNHAVIGRFLDTARNKTMAAKLLDVISDKDLRDITPDVLADNAVADTDTGYVYCHYVLNPRVENEWLTPYKAFLARELNGKILNIEQLIAWTRDSITIDNDSNPQHLRQQPMSVYRDRRGDATARDIFFVSAARSMGWPARLNEVNGKVEYYDHGTWKAVDFDGHAPTRVTPIGWLTIDYHPHDGRDDLAYYTHFTLSKIEHRRGTLLTFADDATWRSTFSDSVALEAGTYLLTTGNRQADGTVLAATTLFTIEPGRRTTLPLELRERRDSSAVAGTMPSRLSFHNSASRHDETLPTGRSYILGLVVPNHEPTNHALNDIATCARRFEKWGHEIILLHQGDGTRQRFDTTPFGGLPANVTWGTDSHGTLLSTLAERLKLQSTALPLFLVVNNRGEITFVKQGYTIHLGEQLLDAINQAP